MRSLRRLELDCVEPALLVGLGPAVAVLPALASMTFFQFRVEPSAQDRIQEIVIQMCEFCVKLAQCPQFRGLEIYRLPKEFATRCSSVPALSHVDIYRLDSTIINFGRSRRNLFTLPVENAMMKVVDAELDYGDELGTFLSFGAELSRTILHCQHTVATEYMLAATGESDTELAVCVLTNLARTSCDCAQLRSFFETVSNLREDRLWKRANNLQIGAALALSVFCMHVAAPQSLLGTRHLAALLQKFGSSKLEGVRRLLTVYAGDSPEYDSNAPQVEVIDGDAETAGLAQFTCADSVCFCPQYTAVNLSPLFASAAIACGTDSLKKVLAVEVTLTAATVKNMFGALGNGADVEWRLWADAAELDRICECVVHFRMPVGRKICRRLVEIVTDAAAADFETR